MTLNERLTYHVTGAIERGEAKVIKAVTPPVSYADVLEACSVLRGAESYRYSDGCPDLIRLVELLRLVTPLESLTVRSAWELLTLAGYEMTWTPGWMDESWDK